MMPPVALLAGGLATRMGPLCQDLPKSLLPVAGLPFIAHQLRLLRRQGVSRVVACTGHLGEQIEDFVSDGAAFGLHVDYSRDGPQPLGTAGALRQALPLLGTEFLVLYGDSYLPTPIAPVVAAFRAGSALAQMTVFRNEGNWDTSNVVFTAEGLLIYDKQQRSPEMRHIDYGLGMFRADALAGCPPGEAFDLADLYKTLLARGALVGYEVRERFYEIGSPAGLAETDDFLWRRS